MPGIVGLITRMPRERAEAELLQMVEALRHEEFYVAGTRVEESLGVYVGWVARKNSFSDGMPLRNEKGDALLVFSGEEFPEPGTVQRLKQSGHDVESPGPSYLVHLYEEDAAFPCVLNGRFHGLLADRTRGTVMLFNDRYGMHRVYYHEAKEAFYFAAEAKAILAVRPELRKLDLQSAGEFIACNCTLENRTLFEGIRVLPPGAKWVFRQDPVPQKGRYFEPQDWESQEPLQPEAYYREVRDVFARNLPRYFDGREPVAMSLTGGLDTRMVLAWRKPEPGSLPCYTFGSMFRDTQDVVVGREVARLCKQPFQVIPVGEEFLSRFAHYVERAVYLTDGCVDAGRTPDLYINEKAREVAPARMTGNYGSEVLRRVRGFKPEEPLPGLFRPEFLPFIHRTKETYARAVQGHPVSFAVFKQAPWYHHNVLSLEQTQVTMRSPYLDNDFVRTVFRGPESAFASKDLCLRLIADGDAALRRVRTDRGVGGDSGNLARAIARGWGEFSFKAEYAYDMGMPQWLAQMNHVLAPMHLERLFLGRHKPFHFRIWYRDSLSGYLQETLLDSRSLARPYIESDTLAAVVKNHVKGTRNYTTIIHKLLTLELVHRLFLEARLVPASSAEPALRSVAL